MLRNQYQAHKLILPNQVKYNPSFDVYTNEIIISADNELVSKTGEKLFIIDFAKGDIEDRRDEDENNNMVIRVLDQNEVELGFIEVPIILN